MDWQAGRVQCSGPLEVTGLNFDHVEAAVAALLDPFADRITLEAGLDLLRPVAPVGIDAAMVAAVVIEQDMSDLRQQDDFHFTKNVHRRRHAGRHAPGAGIPIALATVRLIRKTRFMNCLILGCQWGLLAPAPGLGRVKRSLAPNSKVDRAPQTREVRVL